MADVIYLLVFAGFFALAALFVKACDALVGPDEKARADTDQTEPERQAA